jgi:L-asparaginase
MADILVLTTGGTLDAVAYSQTPENVAFEGGSKVKLTLNNMRAEGTLDARLSEFKLVEVCQKDSKSLSESDLQEIKLLIDQCPEEHVLITHGTDRMPENARWLKANVKGKQVAVTGSMKPLAHGDPGSDGFQNLVDSVRMLMADELPGVWIVMHGKRIDPDKAVKDFQKLEIYETA